MAGKGSTQAQAPAREPVTARGIELLALIAAAEGGILMLTQDEGAEAVAAGYATVDTAKVEGTTAAVSLTDAGRDALTAGASTETGAAAASGYSIDADVPMPTASGRRARSGGYPFEALEVGQSFHVKAAAGKTIDETLTTLSSSVSGARSKFAVQDGDKTETVTVKTFKRGPDGKGYEKDANGKRVVETETTETRPVMKTVRDFTAAKVGAEDPKGEGVRIWRTA